MDLQQEETGVNAGGVPDLSVVVPVFNEIDNLEPLVLEITEVIEEAGLGLELIMVDDGSTDGSFEVIERLASRFPQIRTVRFSANFGQTAAFDAGFKIARGRVVATIDADLQNDPSDIPTMIEQLASCDAVVGYRVNRCDTWLRRVSSRIANSVRNRVSGEDIADIGCSLKVFRKNCLADLKLYTGMHRFLPTLLKIEGYRVIQVPVNHRQRRTGRSKYGVWNRLFRALHDLLAVRWMKKRVLDYEVIDDERE